MTPPWQTAATRPPGKRAMTASTPGRCGPGTVGRLAAELVPATFDHRLPAVIRRLAHLLDRDVVVGFGVVLDQTLDDFHVQLEALRRRSAAVSCARRSGLDTTASIGSCASHSREPRGLVAPARGEPRIGRHAGSTRRDAHGLGVADEEELHVSR